MHALKSQELRARFTVQQAYSDIQLVASARQQDIQPTARSGQPASHWCQQRHCGCSGTGSSPWDDLVVAVAKKPKSGLLGLLELLGLLGLIAVIPATAVAAGAASFAATGLIFLTPGLILAPTSTRLPDLLNPNHVLPWPFNATCIGLIPVRLNVSNPHLPTRILGILPSLLCLPAGDLSDVTQLPDAAVPGNWWV